MTSNTILANWNGTTITNYSGMTGMFNKKNESHQSKQTQHIITDQ